MYEYLSEFERWKNLNKNYNEKYLKIKVIISIRKQDYVEECKRGVSKDDTEKLNLCKKPIIDIEKFNFDIQKRITSVVNLLLRKFMTCVHKRSQKLKKFRIRLNQ